MFSLCTSTHRSFHNSPSVHSYPHSCQQALNRHDYSPPLLYHVVPRLPAYHQSNARRRTKKLAIHLVPLATPCGGLCGGSVDNDGGATLKLQQMAITFTCQIWFRRASTLYFRIRVIPSRNMSASGCEIAAPSSLVTPCYTTARGFGCCLSHPPVPAIHLGLTG